MSSIFGSTQVQAPKVNYTPAGFTSPGVSGSYAGGSFNLSSSGALNNQVGQLQRTFGNAATAFGNLNKTVQPGFSLFRQAGLQDIENRRAANISNLSDTLAQRRILGSSFANAEVTKANAEFDKQRTDFIAQSYLQELQASNQLTQEQFQAATEQFKVGINQMNFDTTIAADLTGKINSALAATAQAQAQLDLNAAQFNAQQNANDILGLGKAAGTVLGLGTGGGNTIGGGIYNRITAPSGTA